jgi:hypothetical protein
MIHELDKKKLSTRLEEIGDVVNDRIPKDWVFFVLVAPPNAGESACNYVSNMCQARATSALRMTATFLEERAP